MTRKISLLLFLYLLIGCNSKESSDNSEEIKKEINSESVSENTSSSDNTSTSNNTSSSNNTNQDYPNFIDAMKMRIFAKEGVSSEFLQMYIQFFQFEQ